MQQIGLNKGILDMLSVYKIFKPEQVSIEDILNETKDRILGFEVIIDGTSLFKYTFKNSILQYGALAHTIKQQDVIRIKDEILEMYIESVRQNENNR